LGALSKTLVHVNSFKLVFRFLTLLLPTIHPISECFSAHHNSTQIGRHTRSYLEVFGYECAPNFSISASTKYRHCNVDPQIPLCTAFNISHYPSLLYSNPANFIVENVSALQAYAAKGKREARPIVEWVGLLIGE
jgi:hypothetical protein